MEKKTTVAIAHSDANLGKPAEYTRAQLDIVKGMIRDIATQSMGGFQNIVKKGDKVLIKVNTVIPCPANAGFTTDPRILEALIELVSEQQPARIQIGERSAMGGDTKNAMDVCGITAVAERTGAELCPFDNVPFDMFKIDRPISFNEFPVPRPVRDADVYIGVPKMKTHVHTQLTCALKIQFGNLPDYDWMSRCHRDDVYQKIVNLNRPLPERKWFIVDSLYACQGNGPFSAYPEDLIRDFNTICGGPDAVAVDTVCEALMDWDSPGMNAPATVLAASEGLGTNKLQEIKLAGAPLDKVKRKFTHPNLAIQGKFPNVNVIAGAACEPGCRSLIIGFDQLHVEGTLDKLKRPLYVFMGLQFPEQNHIKNLDGDIIVLGDCAKSVLERFPNAKYFGSNETYPHCMPIWANIPTIGLVQHVRSLV
jgi:uncharacterized protein (DUF362 family)